MRRHGGIGLCLRHGRQAQAYLPGHLLLRGRDERRGRAVHQDGRILCRAEDREPGTEILRQHRQLLRVHAPVHRDSADAGRRVCHPQAGHLHAEAVRGRDGRRARVPFIRLLPLLQGAQLHGQRVLPDHHAGDEEEPPVLLRRQAVARLSGENPQGPRPAAGRRCAGEVPEQGRGERVRGPLLRDELQGPHRVDDQFQGGRGDGLDG